MVTHHHYLVLMIAVLATVMIRSSEADDKEVYDGIETSFIFKTHGGFIGDIDFPIHEEIDGWNMTITFPKNIFKFEICPAEVVEIVDKRVIHLSNQPWNARLHTGERLRMWFNAKTWRKIRGLIGVIRFEGYIVDQDNYTMPNESSEDMSSSAMGFDNGLTCESVLYNQNKVTCASTYRLHSSGPYVAEITVPVNFARGDMNLVDLTTNVALTFMLPDNDNYNHRIVFEDGGVVPVTGVMNIRSNREYLFSLALDMAPESGPGILYFQVRFGTSGGADPYPILFPYIEDTLECSCTRLYISDETSE